MLGSMYSYHTTRTWLNHSAVASGEIVGIEKRKSHDSAKNRTTTYYHPTVRFKTPVGESFTFTSSVGSSQHSHRVGQQIDVRYLPGDPEDAQVDEFMGLWLTTIVLAFIGLPILLASVGAIVSCLKFKVVRVNH
ncbi:hypothetical protein GCM10027341_45890 [Spirosoma knui]